MSTDEIEENEGYDVEETETDEVEEQKPKKGSRIVLIIAVLALVGLNVFLGVRIMNQKEELVARQAEIAKVTKEKEMLISRVDSLKNEIKGYLGTIEQNDSSIQMYIAQIDNFKKQIEEKDSKIRRTAGLQSQLDKYKAMERDWNQKETELKELQKKYDEEKARAEALKIQVDTLSTKTNELTSIAEDLKNKVELGSRLKASNVSIVGFKAKSGKEKETDKSNQVNRLKVCYVIDANTIAPKGKRIVYICIKRGNDLLVNGTGTFETSNGKSLSYSVKDEISYSGQPTNSCVYFDVKEDEELKAGAYKAEIYVDGIKVAEQNHSLR